MQNGIFMFANKKSINKTKELLSEILKVAESKKTVDDIFNIYLKYNNNQDLMDIIVKFKDNTKYKNKNIIEFLLRSFYFTIE